MTRTAIVIGSGVVGLSVAAQLRLDGFAVTVLDPRAPGEGCSAGNPGGISVSSVLPAAAPGVMRKVPGWLLDRDGPLSIRMTHLPRLSPWLLRFLRAATPERQRAGMVALYGLTRHAVTAWQALLAQTGAGDCLVPGGNLIVYRSRAQFEAETASWDRRRALGITVTDLPEGAVHALVPDLAPAYGLARRVEDNARMVDPLALCQRLAGWLEREGVRFVRHAADDVSIANDGRPDIRAGNERLTADLAVLAAGAWSARLARRLGDAIPLAPERGYSVSWDAPGIALSTAVFSPSEKIMAAPVGGALRFAGTAEFAGFDAAPDWRRAESLARLGRQMFPGLTSEPPTERWAGLRPSTPDGLPVLGRSKRSERVLYAFGHGHLGITTAAVTARIIADLANGRPPASEAAPCAPGRFGRPPV